MSKIAAVVIPVAAAGLLLMVVIVRARHPAGFKPGKTSPSMAQAITRAAPALQRAATQVRPGAEKDLGRAAREAVVMDLVTNLKLAIARGDGNTERALREGLTKYGDDGRAALDREGIK